MSILDNLTERVRMEFTDKEWADIQSLPSENREVLLRSFYERARREISEEMERSQVRKRMSKEEKEKLREQLRKKEQAKKLYHNDCGGELWHNLISDYYECKVCDNVFTPPILSEISHKKSLEELNNE